MKDEIKQQWHENMIQLCVSFFHVHTFNINTIKSIQVLHVKTTLRVSVKPVVAASAAFPSAPRHQTAPVERARFVWFGTVAFIYESMLSYRFSRWDSHCKTGSCYQTTFPTSLLFLPIFLIRPSAVRHHYYHHFPRHQRAVTIRPVLNASWRRRQWWKVELLDQTAAYDLRDGTCVFSFLTSSFAGFASYFSIWQVDAATHHVLICGKDLDKTLPIGNIVEYCSPLPPEAIPSGNLT